MFNISIFITCALTRQELLVMLHSFVIELPTDQTLDAAMHTHTHIFTHVKSCTMHFPCFVRVGLNVYEAIRFFATCTFFKITIVLDTHTHHGRTHFAQHSHV